MLKNIFYRFIRLWFPIKKRTWLIVLRDYSTDRDCGRIIKKYRYINLSCSELERRSKEVGFLLHESCPIHKVLFEEGSAKVFRAFHPLFSKKYNEAEKKMFPYCNDVFFEVTKNKNEKKIPVFYCPDCRKAKKLWENENQEGV